MGTPLSLLRTTSSSLQKDRGLSTKSWIGIWRFFVVYQWKKRLVGVPMACGQRVPKRVRAAHKKECETCASAKAENIRQRMLRHNTRPEQKAAASVAAAKTSARRDIQLARVAKIHAWQKAHPEQVEAIWESARRAAKRSKMETWLRSTGVLTWGDARIRCEAKQKQVDFVSPDHKIWVEVDGYFHFFEPSKDRPRLSKVQERDAMLKDECLRRGDVTLIRLSGQCFRSSDGRMHPQWLQWLTAMLHSPQPGVWCAGGLYESAPWASSGCVILKLPTPSTTSSCPME